MAGLSKNAKELGSVDSDGVGPRPLAENLGHESEHETVTICRDEEHLSDLAPAGYSVGSFFFHLQLVADGDNFRLNVWVINVELTKTAKGFQCLFVFPLDRVESRSFGNGKGNKKEDTKLKTLATDTQSTDACTDLANPMCAICGRTHW